MRRLLAFFFVLGCSNNNPGADAGPDVVQSDSPTPNDAAGDTSSGDGGGCNVTASATITGTFLGNTLTPKDSVADVAHTTQYEVVVGISDYAGICALGNDTKASSNVFAIIYQSSQPLAAGKFDLTQTNVLFAQYTQFDSTCNSPQGESASAGTVTFTRVDSCAIEGSFDLTLNTDHVTGTFTAPVCANTPDGGAGACK